MGWDVFRFDLFCFLGRGVGAEEVFWWVEVLGAAACEGNVSSAYCMVVVYLRDALRPLERGGMLTVMGGEKPHHSQLYRTSTVRTVEKTQTRETRTFDPRLFEGFQRLPEQIDSVALVTADGDNSRGGPPNAPPTRVAVVMDVSNE